MELLQSRCTFLKQVIDAPRHPIVLISQSRSAASNCSLRHGWNVYAFQVARCNNLYRPVACDFIRAWETSLVTHLSLPYSVVALRTVGRAPRSNMSPQSRLVPERRARLGDLRLKIYAAHNDHPTLAITGKQNRQNKSFTSLNIGSVTCSWCYCVWSCYTLRRSSEDRMANLVGLQGVRLCLSFLYRA